MQAKKLLKEKEQQLQMAINGANLGMWDWNLENNKIIINDFFAKMLGYSLDELVKSEYCFETWKQMIHPDDLDKTLAVFNKHIDEKTEVFESEYRMQHKNGTWVWLLIRGKAIEWKNNIPRKVLGTHLNISIIKKLEENEKKLKNIVEHSSNMFYSHTNDHVLTYVSPQVYNILGYSPEEAMIKWTDLITDNPINELGYKLTVEAIKTGKVQKPYELELLHKTGKKIYVEIKEAPIVEKGKTVSIVGALVDITERKQAEKELTESERNYSSLFEQSADGILVGIKGGEIINANESICNLTGYSKMELVGSNIGILFNNDELEKKPLRYDLVKKGKTVIRERNIICKDGTLLPIEMNTKILEDGRMQSLFRDLSKRREAEIEIKKNRDLLEKAEEVAGLGRYYYDIKKDSWDSSKILNKIFGITQKYNRNLKGWLAIVHPDFQEEMQVYFLNNVIRNKEKFDKVYKIQKANNKESRWVHGYGDVEYDTKGNPVKMMGTIQDITERKLAELALQASEEKYRNIFLNSPLGILHYDKNGIITDCNEHFATIIGSSRHKLIGLNIKKDLKNKELTRSIKDSLVKGESYFENWYSSITADKLTYIRVLFKNIKDNLGQTISGIGIVEDITKRKKVEKTLEERTNFLNRIIESSALSMWISDENGTAIRTNQACLEFFGAKEEEVIGEYNLFKDVVIENSGYMPEIKKVFKEGKVANIIIDYDFGEVDHVKVENAKHKIVNSIFTPVLDNTGKVTNVIVQAIDLTEIKKAEKEITKSEEKYRSLFENSQDAIFITDNLGFVDCNEQTLKIFGVTKKEEILLKAVTDFSPEYQPDGTKSDDKAKKLLKLANSGEKQTFEWLHSRMDGTSFFAEVNLIPFKIGEKKYLQSIVRDISERKEIEQRIYNAILETEEKERQRLASDIHDEIGPILSSLKMYIDSLDSKNESKKQDYLKHQLQDLIKETITNVREVSNALSPYLLREYGLRVSTKAFFKKSAKLISISYRTNLKEERFPNNIETVFYRVMKELFNNTIKHSGAEKVNISLNYNKNILKLEYKDNGSGISKEEIKKVGIKGMGLFNIVNRIKSINGAYKFYTNGSKGFKFQLIKEVINEK